MVKKLILSFLFIFLLLISSVSAVGICSLDKEFYHPGESGTVSCACTSPQEEGQDGFFVWRNDSNDIITSSPTTSNTCRTSIFGDTIVFPAGTYLGNVTFAANADGSGTPTNWDGVGDITTDNFNVTGAHIGDCLIQFENITEGGFNLGEVAAIQLNILNAVDLDPLVKAQCHVHVVDLTGKSILQEPYLSEGSGFLTTGADGEVLFQHKLDESFWDEDTTYILEANCYCTPNQTVEQCYKADVTGGEVVGMKTCVGDAIFTTGEDNRIPELPVGQAILFGLELIILYIIAGFLIWFSVESEKMLDSVKLFFAGLGSVLLVVAIGLTLATMQAFISPANAALVTAFGRIYFLTAALMMVAGIGLMLYLVFLGVMYLWKQKGWLQ